MIDVLRWQHALADAGLTLVMFYVMHGGTQLEFALATGAPGVHVHVEVWSVPPLWFTARITDDVVQGARPVLTIRDVGLSRLLCAVRRRVEEIAG